MGYDQFRDAVVSNIRKARKRAELSQEDMSRFGFNIRHYQDIEAGKVRFTLETLYRLSRAFKVPPQVLVKE